MQLLSVVGNVIKKIFSKIITALSMIFAYTIGIGLTAILAKIFRKKFIRITYKNSSWVKVNKEVNINKMF